MNDQASDAGTAPDSGSGALYKKGFWSSENLKYSRPHYRLRKSARIINRAAKGKTCKLLDIGCGPATLMSLLHSNIRYYGVDIAIHRPAPNLIETDFLEVPIGFNDRDFDIIVAQGVFEYVGDRQDQVSAEVARLLADDGIFIVSYVNFGHRNRNIYWPYSNVQSLESFRQGLERHFVIRRCFPTSHNWIHQEPNRKLLQAANMHFNLNIPYISPMFAVEYFFICSTRYPSGAI